MAQGKTITNQEIVAELQQFLAKHRLTLGTQHGYVFLYDNDENTVAYGNSFDADGGNDVTVINILDE